MSGKGIRDQHLVTTRLDGEILKYTGFVWFDFDFGEFIYASRRALQQVFEFGPGQAYVSVCVGQIISALLSAYQMSRWI